MKNFVSTICILLLTIAVMQAQESKEKQDENLKVEDSRITIEGERTMVQRAVKPEIYVDGKKFDFPLGLIDQRRIESVSVIKGEQAKTEYNTSNPVMLLTTKKNYEFDNSKIVILGEGSFASDDNSMTIQNKPLIIVDGEESNEETMRNLSPEDVDDISILKGATAKELYGSKGANGVIVIKTKKKKK